MKIKLTDVRLAFPDLFEAKTVQGQGDPAFGASFLIDANDPQIEKINKAIEAVAKEKWGAKAEAVLKQMRAQDKIALHDGDLKDYDGYAGNYYISSRNKTRPLAIDRAKNPVTAADGVLYAGCYVNASIELWAQDNQFGRRINASLRGVQFYRDGDAFAGGGAASDDEFDDLGVDETADDLV